MNLLPFFLRFTINYALCIMKNSVFLSTIPAIVIFLVYK